MVALRGPSVELVGPKEHRFFLSLGCLDAGFNFFDFRFELLVFFNNLCDLLVHSCIIGRFKD